MHQTYMRKKWRHFMGARCSTTTIVLIFMSTMSTVYRADSDNGANQTLTNVLHNSSSFDIDSTGKEQNYPGIVC